MIERKPPCVSVIIPVYNGENYLKEAIDSVFAQTYKNYELIVVDDGSTDDTWKLIESYKARIRGIQKENGGVASALNKGIAEANGEWIAWLSHDDLFLPDKLEKQINFLEANTQFIACYTDFYIIDANGTIISYENSEYPPQDKFIKELFGVCFINGSSMVINRRCFEEIGVFDESYKYTQDANMWIRIAAKYPIGKINEPLLKWRWHVAQGSRNIINNMNEEQEMYLNIFEKIGYRNVFPELSLIKDHSKAQAKGYELFADIMLSKRNWYYFSLVQYKKSVSIYSKWSNLARYKSWILTISTLGHYGSREIAELYIREGKFLAGRGYVKNANKYFLNAILRHPFSVDALLYWLITLLGKDLFLKIRSFRKKVLRFLF